jgi:hypothetical protein
MIDTDRRYVVIGRGPVAEEIAFLMTNLGLSVKTWGRIQALDSPDIEAFSEDLGVIGRIRPARVDVVTVWPSGTSPSEVTQAVLRLREALLWEGCFTAVMPTEATRRFVAAEPLLPGGEPHRTFLNTRGHIVLSIPVDLPGLLDALTLERPLYLEEWWSMSHRSLIGSLRSARDRLATALDAGSFGEALEVSSEALESLRSTEWWLVAPDHQWERSARNLIRDSQDSSELDEEFTFQVLDLLKRAVPSKDGVA